jgi:peptide/nickel transport system permease protein|tara:strand:+ start:793 stop:1695 length:903 start_codon:yes stop_codon:yes gene_type:complete
MIDQKKEENIRSLYRDVWDQFKRHKGALFGSIVFLIIIISVIIGPFLWPFEANAIDIRSRNQGPSFIHPFGTDQLGRDTFARMLAGGRTSIAVGLCAMVLTIFLGTFIGVTAGFYRRLDGPLMRLTDLFLSLPLLPLLLVMMLLFREPLSSAYGPERGMFILIVFAIGITSWMPTARIVRADVLALKEREFVLAAIASGSSNSLVVRRHILPNVLSAILVSATLAIANGIITESALSFLGLGFPPDFPTWGRLLNDAVDYLQQYPERVFWPGLLISLTVLSVSYLGDGLRDALDPRMRKR